MKVAIIPARGGSKRIPRKNIRPFCGKPIIAYSIEAALSSGVFDRVLVSTDDEEIAEVASKFGAEIPFIRPAALADDLTGTHDVVKHASARLQDQGESPTQACCIYATAPFVRAEDIKRGLDMLINAGKSYAFSVTSFEFPIQRAISISEDGGVIPVDPVAIRMRSQDLQETYHDAGQFYWGTTQAYLDDEPLFSPVSLPVVLPRYRVQDIDTLEDWHRAEIQWQIIQNQT